jgi:hypothetical protein
MWELERKRFLRSGRRNWKGCFQYKNQERLVDKKHLAEQETVNDRKSRISNESCHSRGPTVGL